MSTHSAPTKSLYFAALRCAARIAPVTQRSEWLQEWSSELWYVHEACVPESGISWEGEREVATFCLGAFKDAFCLYCNTPREDAGRTPLLHSARGCAFFLILIAIAAYGLALLLPGVRTAVQLPHYRDAGNLIVIANSGHAETSIPTIRADEYRSWRDRSQHIFTEFAFYQISTRLLHIAPHTHPELSIARSTPNLFNLLGLRVQFADSTQPTGDGLPTLVLSEKLWRTSFHGDRNIIGRPLKLGIRTVKVVGVLTGGSWRLPGNVDAWLLEPDDRAAAIPATTRGYVIARRDPDSFQTPSGGIWHLYIPQASGELISFDCVSLADSTQNPFGIFLFTLFLALLALPATTSLPLGEYPANRHNLGLSIKLRRWIFLWSKLALILPAVYFGSLDLAYCSASIAPETSLTIQGISGFLALLFAFRWTLRDQRRRCPVCLRVLTNPARVGQPSRNFLGWNGTELICAGGHGLLHVPEITTSWFSAQRWLYLDPSWKSLFSKTTLASTGTF